MKQYGYINRFSCLGSDCEDTCCKGWGMQVDAAHVALYEREAPDILADVVAGEAEHIRHFLGWCWRGVERLGVGGFRRRLMGYVWGLRAGVWIVGPLCRYKAGWSRLCGPAQSGRG